MLGHVERWTERTFARKMPSVVELVRQRRAAIRLPKSIRPRTRRHEGTILVFKRARRESHSFRFEAKREKIFRGAISTWRVDRRVRLSGGRKRIEAESEGRFPSASQSHEQGVRRGARTLLVEVGAAAHARPDSTLL